MNKKRNESSAYFSHKCFQKQYKNRDEEMKKVRVRDFLSNLTFQKQEELSQT